MKIKSKDLFNYINNLKPTDKINELVDEINKLKKEIEKENR